jgi:molybdopterin molybdotransferase
VLGPAALGLVASLGLPTVRVFRRAKVAYFSTGDEILSLGEAPREGAVYDSNRYTVFGLLTRLGVEVIDMGVIPDEPAQLEAAFRSAAARADAIITSGGVSMGEADHTKAMMKQLGDVAFWRIAMRPGRPMAVGRITSPHAPPLRGSLPPEGAEPGLGRPGAGLDEGGKSAVLFGLPGNPVAVMVTFLAFVRPALQRLMGAEAQFPLLVREADGSLVARTTGNQGSGVLSSMVQANGLIVLRHEQGNVAVGDTVEVMLFDGVI